MNRLMKQQRGVTFLGFLIVLAVIGVFVFLLLRLYPLYYTKYQVLGTMKSVSNQPNAAEMPTEEIRKRFLRNIGATTNIEIFTDQSVKKLVKVTKPTKGQPKMMEVKFEMRNPFHDDIAFVLSFDEKVPLTKSVEGN